MSAIGFSEIDFTAPRHNCRGAVFSFFGGVFAPQNLKISRLQSEH